MTVSLPTGLGWLPCAHAFGTMLSFVTTYIIAVVDGDVPVFLPSISDTGSRPLERNVFTLLLSLFSVLGAFNFLVRHLQVEMWISARNREHLVLDREKAGKIWNCGSLVNFMSSVCAVMITLSSFLVAAFQNIGKSIFVHYVAAGSFFLFAFIYVVLQTIITSKLTPRNLCLYRIRFAIVLLLILVIFFLCTFGVARSVLPKTEATIIANGLEWIVAFLLCIFMASFSVEFQGIGVLLVLSDFS